MAWAIKSTESFIIALKEYKKNKLLLDALDKKFIRLKEDPHSVGGMLSGKLHGLQSTRLIRRFRLLFRLDEPNSIVYLIAIDHRSSAYD